MKALVTYCSQTGNTEKLAQAIYEGIEQAEKDILLVKDAGDIEGYDVIFCGFPVQAHCVPEDMASFMKNIPDGKKIGHFRHTWLTSRGRIGDYGLL
jgi:flavodoxin